jgi:hypothetical protein
VTWKPDGENRFADPSCWVVFSFVNLAVIVTVELPLTLPGETTTAYGFVAAIAGIAATTIAIPAAIRASVPFSDLSNFVVPPF